MTESMRINLDLGVGGWESTALAFIRLGRQMVKPTTDFKANIVFPKALEQNENNGLLFGQHCSQTDPALPRFTRTLIINGPSILTVPTPCLVSNSPTLFSEIAVRELVSAFWRILPNPLQVFASCVVAFHTSLAVHSDFIDCTLVPDELV